MSRSPMPFAFLNEPALQRTADGRLALLEPLVVLCPDGLRRAVPAGFAFSGSIPYALKYVALLLVMLGFYWRPATLVAITLGFLVLLAGERFAVRALLAFAFHDWCCEKREAIGVDSRTAHRWFYHALLAGGVIWLCARVLHAGVSVFGPRWSVS